ncbi:cell division protein ZapA [Flammeovirga sp. EKP202]|uniref:cell division protein ZapA n=1 Tax=Flammeovirga sp. EKP202 TaxID=2770592 RepID=UPI00165F8182|nr:cell division protein ZapA [Flammeovirga sp. EKP202]MBD0402797.1 cell division protein ZapA [Flammeovirga sp. EKP202]
MGLRSTKESIQLNICGKLYNVKASKSEEHLLKKAAERLNQIVDEKRQNLSGVEMKDLLVITAFDFVVEALKEQEELQNIASRVNDINKQLDEILP